jgi:dienelactone hydrolase
VAVAADPRLELKVPGAPDLLDGVVLLLHGGKSSSQQPVRRTNLAAARMRLFGAAIRRHGGPEAIGVGLLRYRYQGWNEPRADPVRDALWALDEIGRRYRSVPVVLVGHSMGGRTALRVAGHASVTAVAALAPWLPDGEPAAQLAGRAVLIAHAADDRVTDPAASHDYAVRAKPIAGRLEYRSFAGGGHTMLRGAAQWHRMVADFVAEQVSAGAPVR